MVGVDAGALIIAGIAVVVAIVAALYARQQAQSATDSAVSARRAADAANEQVAAARDQVTLGQKQLELAEKIRKEQSEPYVVVDIQPSRSARKFLILIIENIGTTVARNVRFEITPPLKSAHQMPLGPIAEAKILKDGISMLPPGRRYELLFDFAPERAESSLEMAYSVTVWCDGPHGVVEPMHYEIDISALFGWVYHSEKDVHDGVKVLEKVQKDLGKMQVDLRTVMRHLGRPPSEDQ